MEKLIDKALELGAYKAAIIDVNDIPMDVAFRAMCESNACGKFGKNHQCPPHIGKIEDLMNKIRSYQKILVYQTVTNLEDSYDFEGMIEAGNKLNQLAQILYDYVKDTFPTMQFLHLGAGGCRVCKTCAILTDESCRFPERAIGSLEAYGINVSKLAELADMKYINGKDTVTFFGAILY